VIESIVDKKGDGFYIESGSGCGAVWLARLLWEQEVGGSNPLTPTISLTAGLDLKLDYHESAFEFN
jgi:hypothetical protein